LVFEGAEWSLAVLFCLAVFLPLDESLVFNSIGLGEIAPTQFGI
jgi:hypothetical protein